LRTCITYHEKFKQYDLGVNHPFRGDRFVKAKRFFDERGLSKSPDILFVEPEPAGREDLLEVHLERYVDHIFELAERGGYYDIDTPVSKRILEGVMYIIGGVIEAGRRVVEGEADKAIALGGGFHHAGVDYGGGFCLFNDIAILVNKLRRLRRARRVLILDYDVHFGNGTSDIYYSDGDVLFISLHQDPITIYPGRGFIHEVGSGPGEGLNVNLPLPMRTGERAYMYALKEIFPPLAREFKPDIIIANGGSDAHFADHLGSLGLTARGFFELSRIINSVSEEVCGGRAVLLVGSGYNIEVLPYCWYALALGLIKPDASPQNIEDFFRPLPNPWQNIERVKRIVDSLKDLLSKYWGCF
jgi:acetoin utilization protein AcuC